MDVGLMLRRLLGWDCHGEWTRWETRKATYSRPPLDVEEKLNAGWVDTITYTRRWQERQCTICGWIQQRDLEG
jgi:hypothetical protein